MAEKQKMVSSMDDEIEMEEVFVVDTSVIIDYPDVFINLGRKWVIVPTAVIRELDGLKLSTELKKASAARKASRMLDNWGYLQNIAFGAITEAGSIVRIFNRFTKVDDLASSADNRIVGSAIKLQMENKHYNLVLITNDCNMRNVARSYGIRAEGYPLRVDVTDNEIMNGISDVELRSNRKAA